MSKPLQSQIIKNYMAIDRILFGDHNPTKALGENDAKKYTLTKGAFLSNLYEIYKKMGYLPADTAPTAKDLAKEANILAESAMNRAKKISLKEEFRNSIRKEVELNENLHENYIVLKEMKKIAIDALLFEEAMKKGCVKCLADMQGEMLMHAHRYYKDKMMSYV
jgi:hypothetical protein